MAVLHVSKEVLEIILWSVVRPIPIIILIPVTIIIATILVVTLILTISLISYHHFQLSLKFPIVTVTTTTTV